MAPQNQEQVFQRLREILSTHSGSLEVTSDTTTKYCLDAKIGPATVRSWGGKARRPRIPVAWVEIGKSYVSYHLMAIRDPMLQAGMSKALKARMQGKTCFNFTTTDTALFAELEVVTSRSIAAFRKAGFVV